MGQTLSEPVVEKVCSFNATSPPPHLPCLVLPRRDGYLQTPLNAQICAFDAVLTRVCPAEIRPRRWRVPHLRHVLYAGLED
jgi:hypothetical protein